MRSAFALVVVFVAIGGAYSAEPLLGLFAALVLLSATAEVVAPSRYSLSQQGLVVRSLFRHADAKWGDFAAFRPFDDGFVLVRSRAHRSRRSRQDVVIRCPRSWSSDIDRFLAAHIAEPLT